MTKQYAPGDVFRACLKADIQSLTVYKWKPFWTMRGLLVPEDVVIGTWVSKWSQEYSPPPDIQKESTYDDCVRMELSLITGSIGVWMDDGDNFDGKRLTARCSWSISPCEKNRPRLNALFVNEGISRLSWAAMHERDEQIARQEAAKIKAIFEGYFK